MRFTYLYYLLFFTWIYCMIYGSYIQKQYIYFLVNYLQLASKSMVRRTLTFRTRDACVSGGACAEVASDCVRAGAAILAGHPAAFIPICISQFYSRILNSSENIRQSNILARAKTVSTRSCVANTCAVIFSYRF